MAAIFTAADVSTLGTSTAALLVAFVGVNLGFLAYRYSKKAGIR